MRLNRSSPLHWLLVRKLTGQIRRRRKGPVSTLNTAAGTRTFLSAASSKRSTIPVASRAIAYSEEAADRNVRAPTRPLRRCGIIPVRPGPGAIYFLAFWLALFCAWAGQAGEAATTNVLAAAETDESPTNGLGDWIWAEKTLDRQTVQFWKSFEIPKDAIV